MDYFLDFPSVISDGLANIPSLLKELNIIAHISPSKSSDNRKKETCHKGPEDVAIVLDKEFSRNLASSHTLLV
jgi:hypothetical protein